MRKLALPIVALFALNLLAGLAFMNEGLFHYDSVLLAKAVEGTYRTCQLQPAARGRYGSVIINSLLHLPFHLAGRNADFTTRLSSVIFHSLSIAALFLLVYALFGSVIQAVYSALLLSFTPFYFSPNTYGKEHGMSVFFVLLSFYLIYRGVKEGRIFLVAVSSLLFALAISVKESALVIVPLYLALYFKLELSARPFKPVIAVDRESLRSLAAFAFPLVAIFFLLYFTYLKFEFYRETVLRDNTSAVFLGPFNFTLGTAFRDLAKSVPPILFLFALIGLGRMLFKRMVFLPVFLALWFAHIFYFANLETYTARYLDMVVIPAYIAASYALCGVRTKDRLLADAVIVYFAVSMFLFMYPMLKFRHSYNGEKQFAQYVKYKTEPDSLVITMDDAAFIEYYGRRRTTPHPIDDVRKTLAFVREINGYLERGVAVYLTASGMSYDHRDIIRNCFLPHFKMRTLGSKLCEDYHRPELEFAKWDQKLFKLELKYPQAADKGNNAI